MAARESVLQRARKSGEASLAQSIGKKTLPARLLRALVAGYLVLWALLAIAPRHRADWFVENLLVFALGAFLIWARRRLQFSTLAYTLIFAFLVLHTIGAHYTYSETPIGDWLRDSLSLERNHYDRFVHFCYGLLMYLPIWEVIRKTAHVGRAWSSAFTIASIVFFSSFYEILEWCAAQILSPDTAMAYLGTQGDVFDAQKDMLLAMAGGVLAFVAQLLANRRRPIPRR